MYNLFNKRFIVCPNCYPVSKNGTSAYPTQFHQVLPNSKLLCKRCNKEFSVFSGFKRKCTGVFGVVGAFSHWSHQNPDCSVVVGKLNTIRVPLPANHKIFASFLHRVGKDDSPLIHFIPQFLDIKGNEILIVTPAGESVAKEALGEEQIISVAVYAYNLEHNSSWVDLLYNSISNYTENNLNLTIFNLATSIEIYLDLTIERYFSKLGITEKIRKQISKSNRGWNERVKYLLELGELYLSKEIVDALSIAKNEYVEYVRKPRNNFAHGKPLTPSHQDVSRAYYCAFDFYWAIYEINIKLSEQE